MLSTKLGKKLKLTYHARAYLFGWYSGSIKLSYKICIKHHGYCSKEKLLHILACMQQKDYLEIYTVTNI